MCVSDSRTWDSAIPAYTQISQMGPDLYTVADKSMLQLALAAGFRLIAITPRRHRVRGVVK